MTVRDAKPAGPERNLQQQLQPGKYQSARTKLRKICFYLVRSSRLGLSCGFAH